MTWNVGDEVLIVSGIDPYISGKSSKISKIYKNRNVIVDGYDGQWKVLSNDTLDRIAYTHGHSPYTVYGCHPTPELIAKLDYANEYNKLYKRFFVAQKVIGIRPKKLNEKIVTAAEALADLLNIIKE